MDSIDGAKGGHVSSEKSFTIACDPCEYDHISKKAAAYSGFIRVREMSGKFKFFQGQGIVREF